MSELHDKARALIPSLIGASYGLPTDARGWTDRPGEGIVPNNVCTDAADTIAALLAENERLTVERDNWAWRTSCELTDSENVQLACDRYKAEIAGFRARAEAAEARLRELASEETLAVTDANATGCIMWLGRFPPRDGTYLIRRPEMP